MIQMLKKMKDKSCQENIPCDPFKDRKIYHLLFQMLHMPNSKEKHQRYTTIFDYSFFGIWN